MAPQWSRGRVRSAWRTTLAVRLAASALSAAALVSSAPVPAAPVPAAPVPSALVAASLVASPRHLASLQGEAPQQPPTPVAPAGTTPQRGPSPARAATPAAGDEATPAGTPAAAAQGDAPTAPERYYDPARSWSMVLPPGWDEVTPDLARELRRAPSAVPTDLLDVSPNLAHFGPITRWRQSGFDGRSLSVHRQDDEPVVGPDLVQALPQTWQRLGEQHGGRYEIIAAHAGAVGPSAHPTVEATLEMRPAGSERTYRALQLYVPTGGRGLIFSFRTFAEDFTAAEPVFRAAAGTLTLARAARGERNLIDRLFYPLMFAVAVGLLLTVLSKRRQQPQ